MKAAERAQTLAVPNPTERAFKLKLPLASQSHGRHVKVQTSSTVRSANFTQEREGYYREGYFVGKKLVKMPAQRVDLVCPADLDLKELLP